MNWPLDDLVTMETAEVSGWLAGHGFPGVAFVFWDPHERVWASWRGSSQAARRAVLEAIALASPPRSGGECRTTS